MCIYPKCPFAPVPICMHLGEMDIGHLGYPFSSNVHLPQVLICKHLGKMDTGHLRYPVRVLGVPLFPKCPFALVPICTSAQFPQIYIFPKYPFLQKLICPKYSFPKCQFAPSPLYLTPPPFARDPFVLVPNCPGPICPKIVQPAFICIAFIDPKAKSVWLSPGGAIKVLGHCLSPKFH